MYILEGMRPTSTMIIFSHLKLQQHGVCMLGEVAAWRSPWAGETAAIREVSCGAKSHRVTEMVTCSLLEIRLFGLFRENYTTRQVCICKAFILL